MGEQASWEARRLRGRFAALTLVLGAALSCGPRGPGSSGAASASGPQGPVLTEEEVRAIVERTAAARSLPEKRPVRIELLDGDAFKLLVREHVSSKPATKKQEERAAALLLGFNLLPPEGSGPPPAAMSDVLEEQVVGFYDPDEDRVFVPQVPASSAEDALMREGVLSHEVHHALQKQHFGLPDLDEAATEDERLAHLALIEGDAVVAMAAYLGSTYGAPIRRTLRRVTDVTKTVPVERLAHEREASSQLEQALPIARAKLLFPYMDGARFVTDLFRAGGFELINRTYQSPPVSTEQVLHAQRYVDGDLPVPVRTPKPPDGYRIVDSGRMGELQTRVVLSGCVAADVAERAAAGWGGDAYATALGPKGRVALSWATVWDTERDAQEFERALTSNPKCWSGRSVDSKFGGFGVGTTHRALRSGKRVAFARGMPAFQLAAEVRRLIALPGAPVPAKPIGSYTIEPRRPLPDPQPGRIRGDIYRNGWLGIHGRIPSGMAAEIDADGMAVQIRRPGSAVAGGLVMSDRITNPEYTEVAFRQVGAQFASAVGPGRLVLVARRKIRIPLGQAIEQIWDVRGTTVRLRMVMVPVCAGTGSYIFVLAHGDPFAQKVLDGWMHSFRWLKNANVRACDYLDPK